MQTFLPHPNYVVSAHCLDRARLGKQRVECLQILKAISNPEYGWRNHPAVRMWINYPHSLALYGTYICEEWIERGYDDSCLPKIREFLPPNAEIIDPPWLCDERLHSSHRAALLFKDPEWYSRWNWAETPKLDYFWPSQSPSYQEA